MIAIPAQYYPPDFKELLFAQASNNPAQTELFLDYYHVQQWKSLKHFKEGMSEDEVRTFFDRIQAGVTYANRRAGATTGAWPGINPFGGWKASGSTGRGTGGPYYVQQFMREQSRVRVR